MGYVELHGTKRAGLDRHTLVRPFGAQPVDATEPGCEPLGGAHLQSGGHTAQSVRGSLGRQEARFPKRRSAQGRVEVHDLVQQGGAGSWKPENEDGRPDHLFGDGGRPT